MISSPRLYVGPLIPGVPFSLQPPICGTFPRLYDGRRGEGGGRRGPRPSLARLPRALGVGAGVTKKSGKLIARDIGPGLSSDPARRVGVVDRISMSGGLMSPEESGNLCHVKTVTDCSESACARMGQFREGGVESFRCRIPTRAQRTIALFVHIAPLRQRRPPDSAAPDSAAACVSTISRRYFSANHYPPLSGWPPLLYA